MLKIKINTMLFKLILAKFTEKYNDLDIDKKLARIKGISLNKKVDRLKKISSNKVDKIKNVNLNNKFDKFKGVNLSGRINKPNLDRFNKPNFDRFNKPNFVDLKKKLPFGRDRMIVESKDLKPELSETKNKVDTEDRFKQIRRQFKKYWFIVPLVTVAIFLLATLLIFATRYKTRTTTLSSFNERSDGLNSSVNNIMSQIESLETLEVSAFEASISEYDRFLMEFELTIADIKSDNKALKDASINYLEALRGYRANEVESSKQLLYLLSLIKPAESVIFNADSTASRASYMAELDRLIGEYNKIVTSLIDLEDYPYTKALKDGYATYYSDIARLLGELKSLVESSNNEGINAKNLELSNYISSSTLQVQRKSLLDANGIESPGAKKIELVRTELIFEINQVNLETELNKKR